MSSTNKTTNYELSQFIGTDKPAWLQDYNADMGKIDAGIHTAQNTATGADGKADANTTAIGTLANLTTTAKTNLVAAVNEVNTSAASAANAAAAAAQTANTASTTATAAKNEADGLADYFAMTSISTYNTQNMAVSNATLNPATSITVAKNSTSSLGKIYGRIRLTVSDFGDTTVTITSDTGIHPSSDITITPAGIASPITPGSLTGSGVSMTSATIKTNGNIVFTFYANQKVDTNVIVFPCLYFFTDFGDLPSGN